MRSLRLLAALGAAALTIGLGACGDDDDGDSGGSVPAAFDTAESRQVRENFISNCERTSNGQKSYCACSFSRLTTVYTEPKDFLKLDRAALDAAEKGEELPKDIQDIFKDCAERNGLDTQG